MTAAVDLTDFPADQITAETQIAGVGGDTNHLTSQRPFDAQCTDAGEVPASTSAKDDPQTHSPAADVDPTPDSRHTSGGDQSDSAAVGPILRDPVLTILADVVDDLERVRIANENRVRQLTRTDTDIDGEERGFGLTPDHPEVARLINTVEALHAHEHGAILNLQRAVRRHPLGPWIKSQAGVGEKQAARLLAVIGDPYWNDLHDRPRTVSELWAFCGLHVIHGAAPTRRRGQTSNWNNLARQRTWLIAASCVKQPATRSEYRRVYDTARAKYADATHLTECVRCGPKGAPAEAGSLLSAGHQHARAMRLVAKSVLRDLWIAARDIHESEASS